MDISKLQARERNLKIKIATEYINGNFKLKNTLSVEEIKNLFYFREADFKNSLKTFFSKKGKGYILKQAVANEIEGINQYHNNSLQSFESSKAIFIETFGEYRDNFRKNMMASDSYEKYQILYGTLSLHLETLHWVMLPEYDEQIMINRGILPETNILDYYNHYHTLEDLYEVLTGVLKPSNTFKGDINLNKKFTFKVFSRRWDHDDHYSVERRIDGWYVSHISINGLSKKDGSGPLLKNLEHDSIQFPVDGVKYAFETLWDMADETEMSVDELQYKLQEIADWISAVEKAVGQYQPEWCNYY
jgi:hypothetical protein